MLQTSVEKACSFSKSYSSFVSPNLAREIQKAINFAVGSDSTIVDSVCGSIKESVHKSFDVMDINSRFNWEDPFRPNISNLNFIEKSLVCIRMFIMRYAAGEGYKYFV